MNVRELIDLLTKQEPDLEVDIEGCDCFGAASGVTTFSAEGIRDNDEPDRVLIQREF